MYRDSDYTCFTAPTTGLISNTYIYTQRQLTPAKTNTYMDPPPT